MEDDMSATAPHAASRFPLWLRVLLAVGAGIALGAAVGTDPLFRNFTLEHLGRIGLLVIRALKALAVPLVLVAIVDALLRQPIAGRQVRRLFAICLVNVSVAMAIGLFVVNVFRPGDHLTAYFAALKTPEKAALTAVSLDPLKSLESMVPVTILQPIVDNSVIGAVLLAVTLGLAMRGVIARRRAAHDASGDVIESAVRVILDALIVALHWVVQLVPFAAFALVADAVGKAGVGALLGLWAFTAAVVGAMAVHAFVWYPFVVWVAGRRSPREFLKAAAVPISTGIGTNSSLATVPETLHALTEGLGVRPESARLAACIGTNLNNDGITLYEAMAAVIIAQAAGIAFGIGGQISVVLTAVVAAAGIAGIPEAGLVILPAVLAAAGLPDYVVAASIPLVVPVDWMLARCRTVLNVMSDMTVAIVIDAGEPEAAPVPSEAILDG